MADEFLFVRRQWNDWRIGKVKVDSFHKPHWSALSGGAQAAAPRSFVHGYIYCNEIVDGEIGHSGGHGPGPHWIKVCVVKKDNQAAVFAKIKQMADAASVRQTHA